jgi:hypothetical protein
LAIISRGRRGTHILLDTKPHAVMVDITTLWRLARGCEDLYFQYAEISLLFSAGHLFCTPYICPLFVLHFVSMLINCRRKNLVLSTCSIRGWWAHPLHPWWSSIFFITLLATVSFQGSKPLVKFCHRFPVKKDFQALATPQLWYGITCCGRNMWEQKSCTLLLMVLR